MNLHAQATTTPDHPTLRLLGIDVVSAKSGAVMKSIDAAITARSGLHVAFLNANNANIAMVDAIYRLALDSAMVLPDGIGVDLGARILHGQRYSENLNGTDFVPSLLRQLPKGTKVGLYGAAPGIGERAVAAIAAAAPHLDMRVIADGFVRGEAEREALDRLAQWQADILIVAMGTPRQEIWVAHNITPSHAAVTLSVGALLDFLSGNVRRAPEWVRTLRCEWLYRLALEPARLWKRYVIGNPRFILHVLAERFGKRK